MIGTSIHDSRRVDNQARGRAGRQGDPGSTVFCVSAEDELLPDLLPRMGKRQIVDVRRGRGEHGQSCQTWSTINFGTCKSKSKITWPLIDSRPLSPIASSTVSVVPYNSADKFS